MSDLSASLKETDTDSVTELTRHLEDLFVGRPDVIAKRWANKEEKSGYAPICANEWEKGKCKKVDKGSCDSCGSKNYAPVSNDLLKKHIDGGIVLGTYPIHAGNEVTYAAGDFDNHQGDRNPLADVRKLHSLCRKKGFNLYVLSSRSGAGYHAYLFFKQPVPARLARKIFLGLLKEAGINKEALKENSFDRVFPNQDFLSGTGIGNLIALPFQGKAMEDGNTVLLNPDTDFQSPYENQLDALSLIVKIDADQIKSYIGKIEIAGGEPDSRRENSPRHNSNPSPESKADLDFILSSCGFIKHCADDAKTLPEPEWYAGMTIVSRCRNGAALVHEVSKSYPGYSIDETNRKTEHALSDTGPYTCMKIELINGTYCRECKFKGRVKSPIVLGVEEKWTIEPIDIFGDVEIFGEPEWPEDACPPVIDIFARDEAARLGVCPSMIAMAAITVAAASIPDEYSVQPKEFDTTWKESSRLWNVAIAEPGIKKSPAQARAIGPLDRVEQQLHQANTELLSAYEQELALYDKWKRSSKNAEIREKPEKPRLKRKKTNDATVEMLSEILKDNPGGILSHFDEMGRFIASFDCYRNNKGGKDRSDYMELYNGGPRLIDRVSRGSISVSNWSSCILGSIQPGPAKREFAAITDDGLIQRFDFHWGKMISDGEDRLPNYEAIEAYEKLIYNLCSVNDFRLVPTDKPYKFSEPAREKLELVRQTVKAVMVLPSTSNAFRAALDKWVGRFARYAVTFHIIEAVSEARQPLPRISGETAARVARLMIAFLLPSAARFYNEIIPSSGNMAPALWIANFILSSGISNITERKIYRAYRDLRGKPDMIQQAMKILSATGWVEPAKFGKDGRPSKWDINPKCHVIFSKRAEAEKKRREQVKIDIQKATKFLTGSECREDDL